MQVGALTEASRRRGKKSNRFRAALVRTTSADRVGSLSLATHQVRRTLARTQERQAAMTSLLLLAATQGFVPHFVPPARGVPPARFTPPARVAKIGLAYDIYAEVRHPTWK